MRSRVLVEPCFVEWRSLAYLFNWKKVAGLLLRKIHLRTSFLPLIHKMKMEPDNDVVVSSDTNRA